MKRTTRQTASQPTARTSRGLPTRAISTGALAVALALVSQASFADEGGVSFWIPGFYGSLAAAPLQPYPADQVGCFQSQVAGVGPQLGFIFPVGDLQGYLNLKYYSEFAAENRPHGWNTWVTFTISPPAPTPIGPPRRMITK